MAMFKLAPLALALLTLGAPLAVQAENTAATATSITKAAPETLGARIDAGLRQHFRPDAPGATVIVVRDGQVLLRQGYGLADTATGKPMDAAMAQRIGSVTKQFTAVAILQLAEQGKLNLDDDLRTYLPGYPAYPHTVTLRHLLAHSSGIVSYTSRPGFIAQMTRDYTPDQLIDTFKHDALLFKPGERFEYSNSNYFILGAIIEKVTGMPYARYLEQAVLAPAGMKDTAHEGFERSGLPRAAGHAPQGERFAPSGPLSMTQPYASGALLSTVDDLARWDAALNGGKLLRPATLKQALSARPLANGKPGPYGYGWFIGSFLGERTEEHGGGINGFSSKVLRIPSAKLFVAVLTNAEGGNVSPDVLAAHAASLALGHALPFTTAELAPFQGVYRIDDNNSHVVKVIGGRLTVQATGRNRAVLVPKSANTFQLGESPVRFEFQRDAAGAVKQVNIVDPDRARVCVRVGDVPNLVSLKLAPAVLDRWVGRYQLDKGPVLVIQRQGEGLIGGPEGLGAQPLRATAEDRFTLDQAGVSLQFATADGVTTLTFEQGGKTFTAKRLQ
jgi:CubicO group peptidase (beta-lactamase class C family)